MTCYLGEIRAFAGNFAPVGWALCNGKTLQINDNPQLFSLIGTIYGGDGIKTFGLPDLQGRIIVNRGTSAAGTEYICGVPGGNETVSLDTETMPAHSHPFYVIAHDATDNDPQNKFIAEAKDTNSETDMAMYLPYDASGATAYSLHTNAIGSNDTPNSPHENRMPFLAINYIICLKGFYPNPN